MTETVVSRKLDWGKLSESDRVFQMQQFLETKDKFNAVALNRAWEMMRETLISFMPYAKLVNNFSALKPEEIITILTGNKYLNARNSAFIIDNDPKPDNKDFFIMTPMVCYNRDTCLWYRYEGKNVHLAGVFIPFVNIDGNKVPIENFRSIYGPLEKIAWEMMQTTKFDASDVPVKEYPLVIDQGIQKTIAAKDYVMFNIPEIFKTMKKEKDVYVPYVAYNLGSAIFDKDLVDPVYDPNISYSIDNEVEFRIKRFLDTGAFIIDYDALRNKLIAESEVASSYIASEYYAQKFSGFSSIKPALKTCAVAAMIIKFSYEYDSLSIDTENAFVKSFKLHEEKDIVENFASLMNFLIKELFKSEYRQLRKVIGITPEKIILFIYKRIARGIQGKVITKVTKGGKYISTSLADACGLFMKLNKKYNKSWIEIIEKVEELRAAGRIDISEERRIIRAILFRYRLKIRQDKGIKPLFYYSDKKLGEKYSFEIVTFLPQKQQKVPRLSENTELERLIRVMRKKNPSIQITEEIIKKLRDFGLFTRKMDEELKTAVSEVIKQDIMKRYTEYAIYLVKAASIEFVIQRRLGREISERIEPATQDLSISRAVLYSILHDSEEDPDVIHEFLLSKLHDFESMDITTESVEYEKMRQAELREARLVAYLSMTPEAKLESNIENMTYEERTEYLDTLAVTKLDEQNPPL